MKKLILSLLLTICSFSAFAEGKFSDIVYEDMFKQKVTIDEFKMPYSQGILVNIWATWCKPCVKELPSLMKLQSVMPELSVVAVSIDRSPTIVKQFLQRQGYQQSYLTFLHDKNGNQVKKFNISKVPTTLLLDTNGNILDIMYGERVWHTEFMQARIKTALEKNSKHITYR